MNKTIITIIAILGLTFTQAQVAIGKDQVSSPSVSLDFEENQGRGLLLPWVDSTTAVASAVNGTLVYDSSDNKVKVKYDSGWTDLSVDGTGTLGSATQPTDENLTAKVGIGAESSTPGILVLEESNKAMVLPKVEDTDDIINPAAGMMVYLETKQLFAVFNGSVWTFWKAE